jgi:hypothetical protein
MLFEQIGAPDVGAQHVDALVPADLDHLQHAGARLGAAGQEAAAQAVASQLSAFHSRLDVLQRYLLANSICEGLSTAEERDKARAALIAEISHVPPG